MKWIAVLCLACLSLNLWAGEKRVAKGVVAGFEERITTVFIKGNKNAYKLTDDVVIQATPSVSGHLFIVPGLRVSLYGKSREKVSRVLIHGPYSLLKKMMKH